MFFYRIYRLISSTERVNEDHFCFSGEVFQECCDSHKGPPTHRFHSIGRPLPPLALLQPADSRGCQRDDEATDESVAIRGFLGKVALRCGENKKLFRSF